MIQYAAAVVLDHRRHGLLDRPVKPGDTGEGASRVMVDRQENLSGEDSLIARYFKPIATDPGAFTLDDDAAALKTSGDDIVVTTDAVVEGVHFLSDDPPDTLARKALRVNLSDLAAKGATPGRLRADAGATQRSASPG